MCGVGSCPAVFEIVGEDKLVIVGSKVRNFQKLGLSERVGSNEGAVIVDKAMLRQIFEK